MSLHVIYDISKTHKSYLLVQHADSYKIYGREVFESEAQGMLESSTEENDWMRWYNYEFVRE